MLASQVVKEPIELPKMSFGDSLSYIFYTNPVCSTAIAGVVKTAEVVNKQLSTVFLKETPKPKIIQMPPEPLWKVAGLNRIYMKLAGLSGALAVGLTAYGAHSFYLNDEKEEDSKALYKVATKYHIIHSLALLSVPLTRFPALTGSLFTFGMLLFCGSCYYKAFTRDSRFSRLTPIGGSCLILGWVSIAL